MLSTTVEIKTGSQPCGHAGLRLLSTTVEIKTGSQPQKEQLILLDLQQQKLKRGPSRVQEYVYGIESTTVEIKTGSQPCHGDTQRAGTSTTVEIKTGSQPNLRIQQIQNLQQQKLKRGPSRWRLSSSTVNLQQQKLKRGPSLSPLEGQRQIYNSRN